MLTELQLSGISDQRLIQQCIAGSHQYQALLYKVFSPQMFGICLRYASDYHSAEDILQEGFIKVFNNLDRYRGDGSFEGWLKRIFINTAIEYYRKSIRSYNFADLALAHQESLDGKAISNMATQELLRLIQQLPVGYRTVFNLYVIEGYAHKEISKMLDISEGTSKSQLARARATLQRLIKTQQ
ncbi:MAG: sigma-70 family RNA polymerase sigma factor [Bacteroidota bacterium]